MLYAFLTSFVDLMSLRNNEESATYILPMFHGVTHSAPAHEALYHQSHILLGPQFDLLDIKPKLASGTIFSHESLTTFL